MIKKYLRLEIEGRGYYAHPYEDSVDAILSEFESLDVDEEMKLKIVEMEEDEYNRLPEFTGF